MFRFWMVRPSESGWSLPTCTQTLQALATHGSCWHWATTQHTQKMGELMATCPKSRWWYVHVGRYTHSCQLNSIELIMWKATRKYNIHNKVKTNIIIHNKHNKSKHQCSSFSFSYLSQNELKTGFVLLQSCDNCLSHNNIIGIMESLVLETEKQLLRLQPPPQAPNNIAEYTGTYSTIVGGAKVRLNGVHIRYMHISLSIHTLENVCLTHSILTHTGHIERHSNNFIWRSNSLHATRWLSGLPRVDRGRRLPNQSSGILRDLLLLHTTRRTHRTEGLLPKKGGSHC